MSKRRALCLSLCMLLALSLAACVGDDARQFSWAMMAQPTAEPTPTPAPGPDALRLTMPVESGEWNPAANSSRKMQGLMSLCFEPMVRIDDTLKPSPYLAEGWRIEEDGHRYVFVLRSGVYFQDGSALTARDVVRSLDEILIQGEDGPWHGCLRELESWIAEDDRTVVITTLRAGYNLIYQMNFPIMRFAGEGAPIGTGPYQLAEYEAGQSLRLSLQNHWWKQAPVIETVEAVSYADHEAELAARALGDVDYVLTSEMTASLYRLAGVTEVQDYLTQSYDLLAFNFDRPVMANTALRQAIASAIDRKDIISSVYQNHAVACEVPVPPDHWLHEARIDERAGDTQAIRAGLARAGFVDYDGDGLFDDPPFALRGYADALTEEDLPEASASPAPEEEDAGTASPEQTQVSRFMTFTLLTNYHRESPVRRDAALRIADQLKRIGLDVTVREVDLADLPAEIEAGDYDMLLIGYQMPLSGDLRFLLSAQAQGEQTGHSITRYHSERIESLLDIADAASSDTLYRDAVAGIQRLLADELPFVGLYFRNGTAVFNARLVFQRALREGDSFRGIEQWRFTP